MPINENLSLQLYSLRDLGGLDAVLDVAAGAGYRLVETTGGQLDDPQGLAEALSRRDLRAPSGHVGMAALRANLQQIAEAASVVGIKSLFMPALPADERSRDAAGWRAVGEELGRMAAALAATGIAFGYHNHNWEFGRLDDGRTAIENLFEGAAGTPLTWQADIAWIARAGVEPVAWLDRYASILTAIHVEDIAPAGTKLDEDGWTDVGAGTLDWPKLWAAARRAGATLFVVEHDKPKHPAAFATASYRYLVEAIGPKD